MYFVFEGIDGSGKSTCLDRIYDRLIKSKAPLPVKHRFPSPCAFGADADPGKGIGRVIRDAMEGKRELEHQSLMYLFMAEGVQADRWIAHERKTKTLLVDRHTVVTGPVYQQGHHPIQDVQAVYRSHRFEIPDLVFLFDVDYQTHLARRRQRNNAHEDLIFERDDEARFARMRGDYRAYLQGSNPCIAPSRFVLIDATRTIEQVEAAVWTRMDMLLIANGIDVGDPEN